MTQLTQDITTVRTYEYNNRMFIQVSYTEKGTFIKRVNSIIGRRSVDALTVEMAGKLTEIMPYIWEFSVTGIVAGVESDEYNGNVVMHVECKDGTSMKFGKVRAGALASVQEELAEFGDTGDVEQVNSIDNGFTSVSTWVNKKGVDLMSILYTNDGYINKLTIDTDKAISIAIHRELIQQFVDCARGIAEPVAEEYIRYTDDGIAFLNLPLIGFGYVKAYTLLGIMSTIAEFANDDDISRCSDCGSDYSPSGDCMCTAFVPAVGTELTVIPAVQVA